jgi:hypothetical protein
MPKRSMSKKRGSKKSVRYIDKMLCDSIMELKFILSTKKLTPQQDKEVRAELSDLETQMRKEDFMKGLNSQPGISTYGSYFAPYSDIKINSYHK